VIWANLLWLHNFMCSIYTRSKQYKIIKVGSDYGIQSYSHI